MIQPVLKDDALLADVKNAARDADQFHLWWLGQSGFLVQWQKRHLLLDPYLSDSLAKKYGNTDRPHVRMTELVVAPERLDFIDVVTSSHTHTDHLDAETLIPLMRVSPRLALVIPEATRAFVAERLNIKSDLPFGLDASGSITIAGFTIHAVPAAHNELETDEQGRHKFLGYVIRFGSWTIYHSGDTKHYLGMEDWLRQWRIDLALLPINGDRPERRVAGNFDGREGGSHARAIGAKLVIPCHYDMFEFNTALPHEFVGACAKLGQPCRVLHCGERWSSDALE